MAKKSAAIVLLVFVLLSVGYLLGKEGRRRSAESAAPPEQASPTEVAAPAPTPAPVVVSEVAPTAVADAATMSREMAAAAEATSTGSPTPSPYPTPVPPRYAPGQTNLTVYFFHRKERCETCRKIEEYTGELMGEKYMTELEDGNMEWRVYCFEEGSGEKFRDELGLFTSTVVLAKVCEGKIVRSKDLVEQVWQKVNGDKDEFMKYLQGEIDAFRASLDSDETP
ncbi:hypothetical protein JW916_00990 [Candidatus Sumerlaeota bacterium]|nr:hypothetical protein [Candidatus Sumerlaeota bacterium]